MKILNKRILPGSSRVIKLDIAKLHTGTSLEVPVIIERSKEKGPVLLLCAGIHGDEVNGVEIVRQLIANGFNRPDFGTVICVPVVNVFGFINQSRDFPDGRDLNRFFPGSKRGSLASRFAYFMMKEIVPYIDYCIDYHTGGAERFNFAQVRVDASCEESLALAYEFGCKFIKDAEIRDKSFRKELTKLGKKVLLFEGGKSLNLNRTVTNSGILGALRIMNILGMRDFSKEISNYHYIMPNEQIFIQNSIWLRAKSSGMFRSYCRTGAFVHKGESIGSISNPYGDHEYLIQSPESGYIICKNHAPIINQGDALFHLTTAFDTKSNE